MGVGPNYVLDKGFRASGSAAYKAGTFVKLTSNVQEVETCDSQGEAAIGVCQENVDADKVATGSVVVGVRLLGIASVIAGGVLSIGQPVTTGTAGLAELADTGDRVLGIALTAAASGDVTAGGHVDVLLTPGLPAI